MKTNGASPPDLTTSLPAVKVNSLMAERIAPIIADLEKRYRKKTPHSLSLFDRAAKTMIQGGSHSIRLWRPYPFFVSEARGAEVKDVDGNTYIDYWQGHYANILGHQPETGDIEEFGPAAGPTMHTGFENESQLNLAELILAQLGWPDHRIRFTTSGTLAAMYAVMLAMATTGRDIILKAGGGWHGASPYLLKGVRYAPGGGFVETESGGIPAGFERNILITGFNDQDDLERIFVESGGRIACLILEPFLGVGGFLPASAEYLRLARRLTLEYGAVFIADEVISGFRFCPSGLMTRHGIEPDLSVFGKVIGGGHAVAAVAGRKDIMEGCEKGRAAKSVQFQGGTFSAHPAYMQAGFRMLKYLVRQAGSVYPRLAEQGERLRRGIEEALQAEGIEARCTGYPDEALAGSSLFMVHFPKNPIDFTRAEHIWDPEQSDILMREEILKLALLGEGVHVVHGGGAVSFAHETRHIEKTIQAYAAAARLLKGYWA